MLLHDLQQSNEHYEVVPQMLCNHHLNGARINSVAWSHNSKSSESFADLSRV